MAQPNTVWVSGAAPRLRMLKSGTYDVWMKFEFTIHYIVSILEVFLCRSSNSKYHLHCPPVSFDLESPFDNFEIFHLLFNAGAL